LIEECYGVEIEARGIYPGEEVLQVLAIAFEPCFGESREDSMCERRRMSAFSFCVRSWESVFKAKFLEPSQCRYASGHRLGRNVSGSGNIPKAKSDKMTGG
jgi:hypothetical protein